MLCFTGEKSKYDLFNGLLIQLDIYTQDYLFDFSKSLIFIDLKELLKKRERQRELSRFLVHSPNEHNCHGWARPEPRFSSQSSKWPKHMRHYLPDFQVCYQGAGLKLEQMGLESVLEFNLSCHIAIPTFFPILILHFFFYSMLPCKVLQYN